jgi:ribosomal-protein-alanine N-acetyltransferase
MVALASPRLVLKSHVEANFERLRKWQTDPDVLATSADDPTPESEEQTRRRHERWMQLRPDILHLAIHLRESDELIGFLHIAEIEPVHRHCRLGLVIGEKTLWGRGYGAEALRLVADHCFEDLGLNRIVLEVYATNRRMVAMLERVGVPREGVLREHVFRDGGFVDQYGYGLLRRDWEGWKR